LVKIFSIDFSIFQLIEQTKRYFKIKGHVYIESL
jgi:hypothetical protein